MYLLNCFAVAKNTYFSSLPWVPYTISKQKNRMWRSAVRKISNHFNIGDKPFTEEPSIVKIKIVARISSLKLLLFWKSFAKFTRKPVCQSAIVINSRICQKFFLDFFEIFQSRYAAEKLLMAASELAHSSWLHKQRIDLNLKERGIFSG